jgi:hypothetical protein
MMNNSESEETVMAGSALSRSVITFSLVTLFLLCSIALFGVQQSTAPGAPATSGQEKNMVTVPAGTRMMVKMIDAVDSETSNPSDRFRGSLEANLMAGNVLVAPKGTMVYGRLLSAESAGRTAGGQLELDITDIMINGQMHSLMTTSTEMQGENSQSTAGQAARGAGTGAAVGAVVGGGSLAGFGARAGAIAGGVSGSSTRGEKVKVPAGSLVEFSLAHPVSLPVQQQ